MATWSVGTISVTRVGEQIGFSSLPPERFLVGFDRDVLARHLTGWSPITIRPSMTG